MWAFVNHWNFGIGWQALYDYNISIGCFPNMSLARCVLAPSTQFWIGTKADSYPFHSIWYTASIGSKSHRAHLRCLRILSGPVFHRYNSASLCNNTVSIHPSPSYISLQIPPSITMHLSLSTISAALFLIVPTLVWMPDSCVRCTVLCALNKPGCEASKCVQQRPGGVSSLSNPDTSYAYVARCGLTSAGCGK